MIGYSLDVLVDEDKIDDPTLAAIYRLVQEGLNNAVRHGRPERIEIAVQPGDSGKGVVRVADDGTGLPESGPSERSLVGLGFRGMRERVEGLGGSLRVGPGENGKGLVVIALLPSIVAMEAA
jgi:two-component system sensor histidine kinase UhpB